MAITTDELLSLLDTTPVVEKVSRVSTDGRNLLVRLPKALCEALTISSGDQLRWSIDKEGQLSVEVVKDGAKETSA